jgi:dsDNA-specific endonuclease/ATPase MutS2
VRGEADGWSLLLLDELGTGTDPTEGAALGQALLKTLVRGAAHIHRSKYPEDLE